MAVTFGKFELSEKLASGGMGELYVAHAEGQSYALKRIHPHLALRPELLDLFIDEARLTAQLRHPNVVPVLELGRVGEEWYVLMELVRGRSLEQVQLASSSRRRPLGVGEACRVALDAAAGLHSAHQATNAKGAPLGIVHRDVCPANLLVAFSGEVKVIDFGVALASDRPREQEEGMLFGRLAYLAPEAARGERVSPRSDQFSLGVVLWELLTRRALFQSESELATLGRVMSAEIPPPSAHRPEVTAALDAVVLRALSRDPAARFEDLAAFAAALEDAAPRVENLAALMGELFPAQSKEALPTPAATRANPAARAPLSPLAPHHEEALTQLAAFRGGFTVDAAEAVVDLSSQPGPPLVLDVLDELNRGGHLHEVAPGVSGELRLSPSHPGRTPGDGAQQRHLAYFAREAATRAAELNGAEAERARAWLRLEADNLRAALEQAQQRGDPSAATLEAALRHT